jgi:hypothetical protein
VQHQQREADVRAGERGDGLVGLRGIDWHAIILAEPFEVEAVISALTQGPSMGRGDSAVSTSSIAAKPSSTTAIRLYAASAKNYAAHDLPARLRRCRAHCRHLDGITYPGQERVGAASSYSICLSNIFAFFAYSAAEAVLPAF